MMLRHVVLLLVLEGRGRHDGQHTSQLEVAERDKITELSR